MNWFKRKQIDSIRAELLEKRPLPVGLADFHRWSDRIIKSAEVPANDSMKYVLAYLLLDLGPAIAFECDNYFIQRLRKGAVNQVADFYRREVYEKKMQKIAAEKQNQAAVPPDNMTGGKVLEIPRV